MLFRSVSQSRYGWVTFKVNGATVNGRDYDKIRFFILGNDTCWNVFPGVWQMKFGGIVGNGTSMKVRMDSIFSRPYVTRVAFTADTITNITIGAGNTKFTMPAGKSMVVSPMVKFIGTTTDTMNFNYTNLIANQFKQVFDTNIVVLNVMGENSRIYGAWWGMDSLLS